MAHHPEYYKRGTIEVWDFIRDQGLSYHLGNAVKYICRAGYKDNYVEDLEKAIHYLTNELKYVTPEQPSNRVSSSVQYTERFTETGSSEIFDR